MGHSFAPGKIILSGEYAVLFGYAGIAIPSIVGVRASFEEEEASESFKILWKDNLKKWPASYSAYVEKIVALCQVHTPNHRILGNLTINLDIPLGKGMGSSTALIVAITRALLGEHTRSIALSIEDSLNPGHSGIDFATIWEGSPVLFRNGVAETFAVPLDSLDEAILIDTGSPGETTTELVSWMKTREMEIKESLKTIGACTDRIVRGEHIDIVMRDHHKAQVELGVVPPKVKNLVSEIESIGGSAKVIGAGSRTGGAGMVLALGKKEEIQKIADFHALTTMSF